MEVRLVPALHASKAEPGSAGQAVGQPFGGGLRREATRASLYTQADSTELGSYDDQGGASSGAAQNGVDAHGGYQSAPASVKRGKAAATTAALEGGGGKRRGRKRISELDPDEVEDPEERKKERTRMRNRANAAASRARRVEYVGDLERRVQTLEAENSMMQSQMAAQAMEIQRLRDTLAGGGGGCSGGGEVPAVPAAALWPSLLNVVGSPSAPAPSEGEGAGALGDGLQGGGAAAAGPLQLPLARRAGGRAQRSGGGGSLAGEAGAAAKGGGGEGEGGAAGEAERAPAGLERGAVLAPAAAKQGISEQWLPKITPPPPDTLAGPTSPEGPAPGRGHYGFAPFAPLAASPQPPAPVPAGNTQPGCRLGMPLLLSSSPSASTPRLPPPEGAPATAAAAAGWSGRSSSPSPSLSPSPSAAAPGTWQQLLQPRRPPLSLFQQPGATAQQLPQPQPQPQQQQPGEAAQTGAAAGPARQLWGLQHKITQESLEAHESLSVPLPSPGDRATSISNNHQILGNLCLAQLPWGPLLMPAQQLQASPAFAAALASILPQWAPGCGGGGLWAGDQRTTSPAAQAAAKLSLGQPGSSAGAAAGSDPAAAEAAVATPQQALHSPRFAAGSRQAPRSARGASGGQSEASRGVGEEQVQQAQQQGGRSGLRGRRSRSRSALMEALLTHVGDALTPPGTAVGAAGTPAPGQAEWGQHAAEAADARRGQGASAAAGPADADLAAPPPSATATDQQQGTANGLYAHGSGAVAAAVVALEPHPRSALALPALGLPAIAGPQQEASRPAPAPRERPKMGGGGSDLAATGAKGLEAEGRAHSMDVVPEEVAGALLALSWR